MSRRQVRASALVSALLVVAVEAVGLAPAQALPGQGADPTDDRRGRAGQVISQLDEPGTTGPVRRPTTVAPSPTQDERSAARSAGSPATSDVQASATECDTITGSGISLADRAIARASFPGAAKIVVQRQRFGGTWRTVGTILGDQGRLNDTSVNPRTAFLYRMTAYTSAGAVQMACQAMGYYGAASSDGWGMADGVLAGDAGLFQQGPEQFLGDQVASGVWVTPAYSPDGRLLAVTRVAPETGRSVLEVRRARTQSLLFAVDLGADVAPADPAFSPDGQTLAYTRYDVATGEPLGLGLVDVLGSHVKRSLTFDVPVAEPAWRPDGTTMVVTAFDAAEGLSLVCTTCTKATPISGTSGGYAPEVALDGTIWFVSSSGSASLLRKRVPSGTVTTVRSSTSLLYSSPRLAPDGTLYVGTDTPAESDPTQSFFSVVSVSPAGPSSDGWTPIEGWQSLDSGFYGYDVRQVPSPGTAQFTGNGHDDILARDGSGNLWAYRSDGHGGTAARTLVASGWQGMNAVVAAGDLTRDGRADVVARDTSGRLWLYRGLASGKLAARTALGSGWNGYAILGAGDWNRDDNADLVARDGAGTLWLYPGNGRGGLTLRQQMGTGWGGMTAIVASGDADFDTRPDLIARDKAGVLWLYPGNGATGFLARRQLGTGFGSFTAVLASEVTDQNAWLWVRTTSGQLISWQIWGDGAIVSNSRTPLGYGWNGMLLTS